MGYFCFIFPSCRKNPTKKLWRPNLYFDCFNESHIGYKAYTWNLVKCYNLNALYYYFTCIKNLFVLKKNL